MHRGPRGTAWLLRWRSRSRALRLAEPLLIGGYLDGEFDLVAWHGGNGSALPASDGFPTDLALPAGAGLPGCT